MNNLKKFVSFAAVLVAVIAIIGGTAYLLYDGHIFVGLVTLLFGVLAVPYLVEIIKEMLR